MGHWVTGALTAVADLNHPIIHDHRAIIDGSITHVDRNRNPNRRDHISVVLDRHSAVSRRDEVEGAEPQKHTCRSIDGLKIWPCRTAV